MSQRYFLFGFVLAAFVGGAALVWYQHTVTTPATAPATPQPITAIAVVTKDQLDSLCAVGRVELRDVGVSHGYTMYLCEDTKRDKRFIALIAKDANEWLTLVRELHINSHILSQFNEIGYATPRGGLIWATLKYDPAWERG